VIGAASVDWEPIVLAMITFIVSTTVHEAAHALFAMLGGDLTAYRGGQVTLNPLPHIRREPIGMVLIPLITLYSTGGQSCFGYASTPIDAFWAIRHPRRAALMSAAGPLANLLLAAIAFAILFGIGHAESGTAEALVRIARMFLLLNVLLCVFNLVPLPPLDGAGIVQGLVPALRPLYDAIRSQAVSGIVTMIIVVRFVVPYVYDLVAWLFRLAGQR
jgi:Zn-dependent protease